MSSGHCSFSENVVNIVTREGRNVEYNISYSDTDGHDDRDEDYGVDYSAFTYERKIKGKVETRKMSLVTENPYDFSISASGKTLDSNRDWNGDRNICIRANGIVLGSVVQTVHSYYQVWRDIRGWFTKTKNVQLRINFWGETATCVKDFTKVVWAQDTKITVTIKTEAEEIASLKKQEINIYCPVIQNFEAESYSWEDVSKTEAVLTIVVKRYSTKRNDSYLKISAGTRHLCYCCYFFNSPEYVDPIYTRYVVTCPPDLSLEKYGMVSVLYRDEYPKLTIASEYHGGSGAPVNSDGISAGLHWDKDTSLIDSASRAISLIKNKVPNAYVLCDYYLIAEEISHYSGLYRLALGLDETVEDKIVYGAGGWHLYVRCFYGADTNPPVSIKVGLLKTTTYDKSGRPKHVYHYKLPKEERAALKAEYLGFEKNCNVVKISTDSLPFGFLRKTQFYPSVPEDKELQVIIHYKLGNSTTITFKNLEENDRVATMCIAIHKDPYALLYQIYFRDGFVYHNYAPIVFDWKDFVGEDISCFDGCLVVNANNTGEKIEKTVMIPLAHERGRYYEGRFKTANIPRFVRARLVQEPYVPPEEPEIINAEGAGELPITFEE